MWMALLVPALFMVAVLAMQRIEGRLLTPARRAAAAAAEGNARAGSIEVSAGPVANAG